ncbi:MAG: adenosine-specific kinase [Caldisericota bacterium]|nr:adenosine-specific kinase [Caldisericota bacterium]
MQMELVAIAKDDDLNVIIGQSHFIKSVEDIYEAVVNAVPGVKFGLAFNEASGVCLVRSAGTDQHLVDLARDNALAIGAGHIFVLFLGNAYPINVLNAVKSVPEVCGIFAATANPLKVIVADDGTGRGILGVIDGERPRGVETAQDVAERKELLRRFGYKF